MSDFNSDGLPPIGSQVSEENSGIHSEAVALLGTPLLNSLLRNTSISIIGTDLEHRILLWNAGAERLFGYAAKEVVGGRTLAMLYPRNERATMEAVNVASAFLLNARDDMTCDLRCVTRDGRKIWTTVTLSPWFDQESAMKGFLLVSKNATEGKLTQLELNYSLRKLAASLEGIIHAMAQLLESKDSFSAFHQRRVADLAAAIAAQMELPQDKIKSVQMAASIHDIGKIAVPSDILIKPEGLSRDEMLQVRIHPQVGYNMLKDIQFPWPLAEILLQHHERINGTGYPSGLKGESMLLESKILAVADVVESMVSERPYRSAFSIEDALVEIKGGKGELYEPVVADACVELVGGGSYSFCAE